MADPMVVMVKQDHQPGEVIVPESQVPAYEGKGYIRKELYKAPPPPPTGPPAWWDDTIAEAAPEDE